MPTSNQAIRLNKLIAEQLHIGRRAADTLIANGHVAVNGEVARLGQQVTPQDSVHVQGRILARQEQPFLYVLMDKPTGYVCSRRKQGDTPTIYSLLPPQYQHLKTVGRLDKDSSGVILLTNDGNLAHQLTHPSFKKVKKYEITLDKNLQPIHRQMITEHGIQLPDGPSKLQLDRLQDGYDRAWLVTMQEGRNRQIRRTFAALGYEVIHLRRTQFGPYGLSQLRGTQLAQLDAPEV